MILQPIIDQLPQYTEWNVTYRILLVNSHSYYNFKVEIGTVTNRDFYIEIVRKV